LQQSVSTSFRHPAVGSILDRGAVRIIMRMGRDGLLKSPRMLEKLAFGSYLKHSVVMALVWYIISKSKCSYFLNVHFKGNRGFLLGSR
jgi:hypothetical protein